MAYIREVRSSIPDLNRNILISQPWFSSFSAMNEVRLTSRGSCCHWCDSRNLLLKNPTNCTNTSLTTIDVLKSLERKETNEYKLDAIK